MSSFDSLLARAHKEIWEAFVTALQLTRCKHIEAARGMRVTPNTITNYVNGNTPVNVARVLAFPKIEKAFRDTLCSFDHSSGSSAYVAKKRRVSK